MGLPKAKIENITAVYSHPIALAQCEDFLDSQLSRADRHEYFDTARSVKKVMELNDPTIAAVASKEAAKLHQMEILAHSIETNKQNYTRFVVLKNSGQADLENTNKTSIVFETDHNPGALYKALGVFAERNINLTKLQSRPIIGRAWHYMFYIDIEEGISSQKCRDALSDLKNQGCTFTVLGSYVSGLKQ